MCNTAQDADTHKAGFQGSKSQTKWQLFFFNCAISDNGINNKGINHVVSF